MVDIGWINRAFVKAADKLEASTDKITEQISLTKKSNQVMKLEAFLIAKIHNSKPLPLQVQEMSIPEELLRDIPHRKLAQLFKNAIRSESMNRPPVKLEVGLEDSAQSNSDNTVVLTNLPVGVQHRVGVV